MRARTLGQSYCAGCALLIRLIPAVALLAGSGCIQVPLRNNTVNEARTVADLYQQQVLNNLAMFAHDPNSVPYFSFANQSSSSVNDSGRAEVAPGWGRLSEVAPFLFTSLGTDLSAERQAAVGFTLSPVNDPRKLELMRCAYQKAIAGCTGMGASTVCPDCQSRFKTFYTGSIDGDIGTSAKGMVTSDCLGGGVCWLGMGCKKEVPKGCPCQLVGQYCGTYVWVLPGESNELAKLTLAILDYAINPFPTEAQKSVWYYIDARGLPATRNTAVGVVSANIGVTEDTSGLLNISSDTAVKLRDELQKELDDLKTQIDAAQKANHTATLSLLLEQQQIIQGQLNFLEGQVGPLKHTYIGGPAGGSIGAPSGPGGGGVLFLNQQQSALGGVTPRP